MALKIWWQHIFPRQEQMREEIGLTLPFSLEEVKDRFLANLKRVARSDTEIDFHYIERSAYLVQTPYFEMMNNIALLDGIIEAEKQGFDAAVIGCADDPALHAARQAVDIPVVAPTEAAMHLACMLGSLFGMITVLDELVAFCERSIRNYGIESRAVRPIRVVPLGEDWIRSLFEIVVNPQLLQPRFDEICRACVADGAEVILPACCALSPAATLLGYREVPGTGVPLLDVTHAAVKMAETLVDLKRTTGIGKSQRCTYKSVPQETRDALRTLVARKVRSLPIGE